MKDAIDSMIESWASGGGKAPKAPTEAPKAPTEAPKAPTEAPKASETPEVAPKAPGKGVAPLDAALAIYEALKDYSGRRPSVNSWVSTARETLGAGRLTQKRFQEVLEAGYAAKLFRLDETTLSYPILEALEPAREPEDEPDEEEHSRRPSETPQPLGEEDSKDFDPPTYLPCGHWTSQSIPDPDREPLIDRGGHQHVFRKNVTVTAPGPETCPACAAGTPGHPQYQKGEWRTPVPVSQRRTVEKSSPGYPGYPGLCTDPETGLYIGGLGNNCSRYNEGPERCVYHASLITPRKSHSDRRKE
jgi:hypothetical protein